jgi:hypothetical protein
MKKIFFIISFALFFFEKNQAQFVVSADKMNVFYVGVDNPISLAVNGWNIDDLDVCISNGIIEKEDDAGKYNVRVWKGGITSMEVRYKDTLVLEKTFRVKRIPDPVAQLPTTGVRSCVGGGPRPILSSKSLIAVLESFDFDAKCSISSFNFTYLAKRQDPVVCLNIGGDFSSNVSSAIQKAQPGDTYYFDEVKARCPGDEAGRTINSLVIVIK